MRSHDISKPHILAITGVIILSTSFVCRCPFFLGCLAVRFVGHGVHVAEFDSGGRIPALSRVCTTDVPHSRVIPTQTLVCDVLHATGLGSVLLHRFPCTQRCCSGMNP